MAFVPENAPLAVLGFLATCAVLLAAASALVFLLVGRKFRSGLLLHEPGEGARAGPDEVFLRNRLPSRLLGRRDGDLRNAGNPSGRGAGPGTFYAVTVRTWFDERTISSGRGNAPLRPHPREV